MKKFELNFAQDRVCWMPCCMIKDVFLVIHIFLSQFQRVLYKHLTLTRCLGTVAINRLGTEFCRSSPIVTYSPGDRPVSIKRYIEVTLCIIIVIATWVR